MLWYDEFWTFKTPITYQKPTWNHSKLLWLEFFGRRWGPLRSRVSLLSHGTLGKCAKCSRSSVTTTGLRWWEGCKRSYLDLPSAWDIRNWLRKKWNIGVRSRLDRLFQVSGGPCFWGKDTACVIVLRNNLITVCPRSRQPRMLWGQTWLVRSNGPTEYKPKQQKSAATSQDFTGFKKHTCWIDLRNQCNKNRGLEIRTFHGCS